MSSRDDGPMSWGGLETAEVVRNRLDYYHKAGLDPSRTVGSEQVHSTNIRRVTEVDAGRGALSREGRIEGTDGLVTNVQHLVLTALHADCAPIFLVDRRRLAIGLAHAGRRGIVAGMPGAMVATMAREFGSDPMDLEVAVGPMICPRHYPVSAEIAAQFRMSFGSKVVGDSNGKPHVDLWGALVHGLNSAGVPSFNIGQRPPCTAESNDFASYRRDGSPPRSMMAWMMIR
jgi:YfiH family protein